jgi:hypothetical protein
MPSRRCLSTVLLLASALTGARSVLAAVDVPPTPVAPVMVAPAVLPGQGLAQHSFLYNGEWDYRGNKDQTLYVVRGGKVVWSHGIPFNDATGTMQELGDATMLSNGNTVICNWCPADVKDPKNWLGTVQVLEVTPDKKVVWALSEWNDPDLGPASSIQLLDEPGVPENGEPQR